MKKIILILLAFSFTANAQTSAKQKVQDSPTPKIQNELYVTSINSVTSSMPSPNFAWKDKSGKQIIFRDLIKGKYALVNFWATWCGPCKKELPDLVELSTQYAKKNVQFIGISLDRDSDVENMVRDFAKENNLNYPILIGSDEVVTAFGGIRGIPTTFLIDNDGKIVEKIVGMRSKDFFIQSLDKMLQ